MTRFTGFWIAILAFALASCSSSVKIQPPVAVKGLIVSVPGGSYTQVSPEELHSMLAAKDFTFVNVHTPFAGNIAGTDLSIPYDQIDQNQDKLPADKSAKIVLYCRSGHMSAITAKTLINLGYTNIWELKGGMASWEQAGYKVNR